MDRSITVYRISDRQVKEQRVWGWRVPIIFALASAVLITLLFIVGVTTPTWIGVVSVLAAITGACLAVVYAINLCLNVSDGYKSMFKIQKRYLNRRGWTIHDRYAGRSESEMYETLNMVRWIRDAVREFPDIDTLKTLLVNAEACAHSYATLTGQYNYFRDIKTPGASMSRETVLHDRDKVSDALRDVYTAAHALVNTERTAIAEDKAKALEMSTSPYTGDVSDLVTRAADEARLAREYINNR